MISFLKDINPNNIIFGRKQCHSSNLSYFPLSYNLKKSPFIIQINDLYSKFGINTYLNKSNKSKKSKRSIDFTIPEDKYDILSYIDNIREKVQEDFDTILTSPIRESKYGKFIRCKIPDFLKIYSSNEEHLDIDDIENNQYCDCIIQIKGLWYMKPDYGDKKIWFDINILQMRIDTPIYLKNYSFIDSKKVVSSTDANENNGLINNSVNSVSVNSVGIPEKYRKMMAMGIPKEAVYLRMDIDGVPNPASPKNKSVSKGPIGPIGANDSIKDITTISIVNNINLKNTKSSPNMSLNDMLKNSLGSVNLKKVTITKRSPNKYKTPGYNAPSLDEITNALKFLKKVN